MSTSSWKSSQRKSLYESLQAYMQNSDSDNVDTSDIALETSSDNYIEKKLESIFQKAKNNKEKIITEKKFGIRGGDSKEYLQYSSMQSENTQMNGARFGREPFQKITTSTNNKSPIAGGNFETNKNLQEHSEMENRRQTMNRRDTSAKTWEASQIDGQTAKIVSKPQVIFIEEKRDCKKTPSRSPPSYIGARKPSRNEMKEDKENSGNKKGRPSPDINRNNGRQRERSKNHSNYSTPERKGTNETPTKRIKPVAKKSPPPSVKHAYNKQSEILLRLLNTNYRFTFKVKRNYFDRWKVKTLLKSPNAVITATTVEEVYESDPNYCRKKQLFQNKQILQKALNNCMRSYMRYLTDCFYRWKHKSVYGRDLRPRKSKFERDYFSTGSDAFQSLNKKESVGQLVYIKKINMALMNICKLGNASKREAFGKILRSNRQALAQRENGKKSIFVDGKTASKGKSLHVFLKYLRIKGSSIFQLWRKKCTKPSALTNRLMKISKAANKLGGTNRNLARSFLNWKLQSKALSFQENNEGKIADLKRRHNLEKQRLTFLLEKESERFREFVEGEVVKVMMKHKSSDSDFKRFLASPIPSPIQVQDTGRYKQNLQLYSTLKEQYENKGKQSGIISENEDLLNTFLSLSTDEKTFTSLRPILTEAVTKTSEKAMELLKNRDHRSSSEDNKGVLNMILFDMLLDIVDHLSSMVRDSK